MTKQNGTKVATEENINAGDNPVCGVIMPIAKTEGYNDNHWADVYGILCEVASDAGFCPNLVSFDDDVGIIHKRIVHNIYSNPIVICDISSRNANVMLELGMRLAFDKPTIIVKDNKTPYSFDIAAIEHLEYPSDLRYQLINEFKINLKKKIIETYKRSTNDPDYTTFLKHFGTFKVAKLDEREVTGSEFLVAELRDLKELVLNSIAMTSKVNSETVSLKKRALGQSAFETYAFTFEDKLPESLDLYEINTLLKNLGLNIASLRRGVNGKALFVEFLPSLGTPSFAEMSDKLNEYLNNINS
ncbi:hypothetical protein [Enterobacter hormaechei]|uniref:hypothetical protein n=1 Tax=Enterobacter hormaechei TaxID=158836 RepID=UPI00073558EB|nr:hypothetical protein [Enterobacter hormaechei]KTI45886.1 hypothetical protein ASV03_13035 [Enterobacter hormaechei subsp. steigerwaltii]MCE1435310.1 hypothetical protein [Enterobacter hormaechei]MCE1535692.1 hypothetical protein [Enterobacter hormaechei]MCE1556271.1 hypothetical protein [Enterobacter hormaechei]